MTEDQQPLPLEELEGFLERGETPQLENFFGELPSGETARILSRLSFSSQNRLLGLLSPEQAAGLVETLSTAQQVEVFQEMPAEIAVDILLEMPSNERADLLGTLEEDKAETIYRLMDPRVATEARQLAQYPASVAGGLMITEYLSYRQNATVGEVIADFQRNSEAYSDYDVQYAYVVRRSGVLAGVLRLRDLLLAGDTQRIDRIMISQPLSVQDTDTLRRLGEFFDEHQFVGVPVTDASGFLVGIVRRHDVEEALADRSDSDYLKSQGIVGGEELRTMPLWRRSSRRLSWLSINILLNIVAASVIAMYQETLASAIALAVFLPIISDMSGCSGNQAVAVSMRELSLGLIKPFEALRVWLKEISVGMVNGIALGVLLGLAAWFWKGNAALSLVVASAMALNTLVAVSIGGTVPLLLKRLKFDPALASGPILTTITDMCGFFFVLSLATLMLVHLQ
jgi:magnesium transporter